MDKREYFLTAVAHGNYRKKEWINDCFAITQHESVPDTTYPWQLINLADGTRVAMSPDPNGSDKLVPVAVTGGVPNTALFDFKEAVTVDAQSGIPNLKEKVATTYGNILRNLILLVYPFGELIPFQVQYDIKAIERKIAELFMDEPDKADDKDPARIYPSDYWRYAEGVGLLRGIAYYVNPSASPKSMTISKHILDRRDELYAQHKDELNDPAVLAKIAQELSQLMRADLKGDPSEGFFIKDKMFDVARMKMFIMLGTEPSLSTEVPTKPVLTSLSEGWDPENLPEMINGLRYGSYARGKLTEFGGTIAKLMMQAFRDAKVTEDDCKSTSGLRLVVRDSYRSQLLGLYRVGSDTPLTDAELKGLVGQSIQTRSPLMCKAANNGWCARCIGDNYSKNPKGLSVAALTIGNIFMYIFMAAMHGKSMETRKLDVRAAFS